MIIDFVKCGLRVEAQGWKKRKRSVREKKENEKQGQAKEKDRKRKGKQFHKQMIMHPPNAAEKNASILAIP